MKNRKLSLNQLTVTSFITKMDARDLQGGVSACSMHLNETMEGDMCYTYGHDTECGSTGNTDNPTGWTSVVQTQPSAGCIN